LLGSTASPLTTSTRPGFDNRAAPE
jgi:hypothetical protein